MVETYYACPKCGTPTHFMELLQDEIYEPTLQECQENPDMMFLAHETLLCPCGNKNTWFNLISKIKDRGKLPSVN